MWLSTGKYRVRTGESQGTDTVTVEVTPGVQTRGAPGAGDFSFYATPVEDRSYTFGSTVCDAVTVICRASDPEPLPYDPWDILAIEFEEKVYGEGQNCRLDDLRRAEEHRLPLAGEGHHARYQLPTRS